MAKSAFSFSPSTVKSVVSAFAKASKAELSAKQTRSNAGQKLVDEFIVACNIDDKEKFFKSVDGSKACTALFEECNLPSATAKNYSTSVKLAFMHGVPFTVSLFTKQGKEAAGIATPSAGTADNSKSGKVKTTTQAETDKTFSKVLAQLRILKQNMVAAELIDVYVDAFPDFKETVLGK